MKMFALLIPAMMISSLAFAQGEPATAGAPAAAATSDTPKTAKEAKKACKTQAAGDKKAMKQCMKDWKKSQSKN